MNAAAVDVASGRLIDLAKVVVGRVGFGQQPIAGAGTALVRCEIALNRRRFIKVVVLERIIDDVAVLVRRQDRVLQPIRESYW